MKFILASLLATLLLLGGWTILRFIGKYVDKGLDIIIDILSHREAIDELKVMLRCNFERAFSRIDNLEKRLTELESNELADQVFRKYQEGKKLRRSK